MSTLTGNANVDQTVVPLAKWNQKIFDRTPNVHPGEYCVKLVNRIRMTPIPRIFHPGLILYFSMCTLPDCNSSFILLSLPCQLPYFPVS